MITLTLFQVSTLITAFVSLFLGLFVFFSGEKTKLNLSWLLTSIFISLWSIGLFGVVFSTNMGTAWFWQYVLDIGGICVPIMYFNFLLHLTKKDKKFFLLQTFSLLAGTALIILNFTNLFKTGISPKFGINFWVDPGKLYFLFPFYFTFFVSIAILLVIKEYRAATDKDLKRQLMYVLMAQIFGFGGGATDFLPQLFNVYPFGNYFVILYVIFISYAALKHHLFDMRVIATELLTFLLWAFLLIKALLSGSYNDFLLNGFIFIAVVIVGALLIRSVIREVKQKEKMEKMAKDIEKAYEAEKLAKEKVEAARVEDEALLTSIGDGVVAIDKEGKIMFINRAAQELLALKNEDVIGKPFEEILTIENEKGEAILGEKNPLRQALTFGKKIVTDATGGALNTVYYYIRSDKTKFPAAVTVAPVVLGDKIIGAIDVFRDVTVERQVDRSKSEFVSLASHQLRTPLTAIKWYSEILEKEKLNAKGKRCLREIYHGNERMIKLIDIMLNISRFEAGKIKMNAVPTDIKKILEDIINEQKSEIKKRSQKFTLECPNDLPKTLIDQNLFRLVFQNLISNAIKYTPAKGEVSCKVAKKDNVFLFEVADTGIGIPEAQQKRVFEKLFRADNVFTHEPEGTGLGLYAAKMTAESLGGKIWFKSKTGKGTTFFVELPIRKI